VLVKISGGSFRPGPPRYLWEEEKG